MKRIHVGLYSPTTPGMVADARAGDVVQVERNAASRADWGAMTVAIGTAFVRGARVEMEGVGRG